MSESIYQPLTIKQIEALLTEALESKEQQNVQNVARIQIRLVHGIKGIEVPYPVDGHVARKMAELESEYVDFVQHRFVRHRHGVAGVRIMAKRLHEIMES